MKSSLTYLAIVFILSLGTVVPLFYPGFFDFHDDTQVARVFTMAESLMDGMFPVRWVEDLGYGYGYPIFNFYAPLSYYIGALFLLAGLDALHATKLMIGLGMVFSGITMFFAARKFFGNTAGLVSAVVYLYFPYHAVNLYVRGAVAELFAYAFLPLIFLGVFSMSKDKHKTSLKNRLPAILFISLGTFFVIVSHNLSALMLFIILVPLVLLVLKDSKNKSDYAVIISFSLITGVLLSAFYSMPAFLEMGYTNVSAQIGGGADYKDHFVCLSQLWNGNWGFGGSVPGCVDGMSFKIGKFNAILLLAGISFLTYRFYKRKIDAIDKLAVSLIILTILTVILMLEISNPLWNIFPFMKYIQYPWRFINFTALFTAFLAGYLVYRSMLFGKAIFLLTAGVIILTTIFTNFKLFTPQEYFSFESDHYTSEVMLKDVTSKVSDEYLPKDSSFPLTNVNPVENLTNNGALFIQQNKKTGYRKFYYESSSPSTIMINSISYYPSWQGYFESGNVPVRKSGNSTLLVELPSGSGVFELKFKNTPIQLIGNLISLIAFLGLFAVIIHQYRHGKTS